MNSHASAGLIELNDDGAGRKGAALGDGAGGVSGPKPAFKRGLGELHILESVALDFDRCFVLEALQFEAVQGGDIQDQVLVQFLLNVMEFGMNVQQAAEAANIISHQMQSSFGAHQSRPGGLTLRDDTPRRTRERLSRMGYDIDTRARTSGPITAIYFDWEHGTMWGGASDHGEDYGIAW